MAKAWHGSNTEKSNAKDLAWYAANKSQAAANGKLWAAANPEKLKGYRNTDAAKASRKTENYRAKIAVWQAANREIMRIHCQNNRAKKVGTVGVLSRGLIAKLYSLQQGSCPCCQEPLDSDFHIDHITAISQGGANVDSNIQLLRATCNAQKHAKNPVDFMQSRGFLL